MSKNKLKALLVFVIAALISVLMQITAASAQQTAKFLPIYPAASWTLGSNAPDSIHFGKVTKKFTGGKTAPEACTASPSNQVSWYRGENNGNDSQGTNNGTLGGGADFAPGKIGQSFRFDTPGEVLTVAQSASVNVAVNGSITMEAWIKPNTPRVTLAPEAMIFIWRNNFGDGVYFARDFQGRLAAEFQDLNRVRHYIQTDPDVLTASDFQHVAATYSSTTGIGTIYLNGSVVAAQSLGSFTLATNGDFRIGNNVFSDYLFDGIIDEPAIYNRALSQTEIQSIFDAGSTGKCGAAPLQISPTTANVATGATQNFTVLSGAAPYAFSVLTNNSGGSIDSATGIYTAGTTAGTTDTIRVTDALGATADASVTIAAVCTANQKTWDGGGATNNWSDAANWTCDALPTSNDTVIFDGTSAKDATIDTSLTLRNLQINNGYTGTVTQGSGSTVAFNAGGLTSFYTQSSGTFACGGAAVSFSGTQFTFSGGRFNCAASGIDSAGTTFTLNGGIFDMPSGTFTLGNDSSGSSTINRGANATVNHSGGTLVLRASVLLFGGNQQGTQDFNNVTVDTLFSLNIGGTIRALGALDLQRGVLSSGTIEAFGNLSVAQTFNNANETPDAAIKLLGTATRTVTLPTGLPRGFNPLTVNAPNTIVNTSGTGLLTLRDLFLQNGAFQAGAANVSIDRGGQTSTFNQSGGILDGGSGNFNFRGTAFAISGGTFTAPSGTATFNGSNITQTGGTFNPNGGTIICVGGSTNIDVQTAINLNNLTVNTDNFSGLTISGSDTLNIAGNLNLIDGVLSNSPFSTVDVEGDMTVGSNADGGSANIKFSGTNNQTFANNGGANPVGGSSSWIINKPSGKLTAATGLNTGNLSLNIASGTLYLNNNSNLTTGALVLGANGKLVSDSATVITLGGNVSNSGTIDLQGGGAGCPENDTVLIRSSDATQRTWTGSGRYRLVDVDVQNMGGTSTKTVFSGTNSGGNNASWIFDASCPAALSITPSSVNVQTGQTQTFVAGGGGFAPFVFSILTNNSGGSINASSGVYKAGMTAGTTDTVRVTDALGATADASVTVASDCIANQKTWDGGGATNNWSDAANWTCDALPTSNDTVIFDGTSTKDATIDINLNLNILNIRAGYAGTIAQGASSVTLNGLFNQAGGTFDGGSGATVFNNSFEQTGGTFNASVGTTTIVNGVFKREAGATFNHRSGTFVFAGNSVQVIIVGGATAAQDFGNLAISTPGGLFGSENDTLRVNGSLNLNNGAIFSIVVEALGEVTIADTFGNGTPNVGEGRILFSGAATRVVNLPVLSGSYNAIELDAPNTTVNLSGAGEIRLKQLFVKNGLFNAGTTDLRLNVGGSASSVSGGVLDCGSGVVTFDFGTFTQTGGAVNCRNATVTSTTSSVQLTFNGGIFDAPTGTMTFNGGVFERGANGTFNHNNGTVIFAGNTVEIRIVNGVTALQEFGNLTVATSGGLFGSDNDPLRVKGNLNLSGQAFSVNFEAQGNVSVPNGFSTNTSTHISFTGSGDQTFSNGGGANATGNWTINKASGTVTALTSLILAASQPLNITSGTLYLNENSNLTVGAVTVGTNGKLVNESSTTITLGGNLINNGVIDLQGGGAGCPENDTILIRSSDATQRTWTGAGRYRLVDVDVQRMGGTSTKTVFSGTNGGGNNASWIFDASCPAALSITPSSATVQAGGTRTFAAGGGFAPYVFSVLTNNSGGSINASTGVYTAGMTAAVTDTIRVTDVFGATGDATVNVSGTPTALAFTAQPSSAIAGQIFAPALQVAVQDQFGNTVTGSNAAISLSIVNNTQGAVLSGTLTKNAVNGVATFDNLSINLAAEYRLQATSGSLNGTSDLITIFAGQPDHLAFITQPSNAFQSRTIQPPVAVAIVDSLGNAITNPGIPVTVAIGANPGGATLLGNTTRPVINGAAGFLVAVDRPGFGYTLTASAGTLPIVASNPFDVINPFLVTNTNDSGTGSLRQAIINANSFIGVAGLENRTVVFNIPGAPPFQIIRSFSNYPALGFGVSIDGTTQPGFNGTPVIFLSGPSVGLALTGGNTVRGLNIFSATTAILESGSQNRIQGNFLSGTFEAINARGFRPLIGGTTAADRNVISNSGVGIILAGANEALVTGNYIGTDPTGLIAQPNRVGIAILGSDGSRSVTTSVIGGDSAAEENLIAFNRQGITLFKQIGTPSANIKRNSIHSSTVIGIDFGTSGVTPNDPQDADSGENQLQNFPVLESAVSSSGTTTVKGSLNSVPLQNYVLNFYSSAVCSPSGSGDGELFIGSANVSTDAGGISGFTTNLPVTTVPGRVITATATDASGNTSEFSKCQTVASQNFSIAGRITTNSGNSLSGVIISLQGANLTAVTDSNGNYIFANLPAGGNYTLVPVKVNFTFSPATLAFNNLSANQTDQNLVATAARFRLSGQVKSIFGAATFPLSGVIVTLNGAASAAAATDENGNYAFDNLLAGNYSVTPAKPNFNFNPSAQNISLSANRTVDFSGGLNPPLEGRVFQCTGYVSAMNADGSARTEIIPFPTNEGCSGASVSRDGRKLVYYTNTNKIYTANSDGSVRVLLSQEASASSVQLHGIAISNNRQKVAFTKRAFSVNRNDAFLRVMNADGSNLTTIYAPPTGEFLTDLNWSPDGNKIVFIKRPNTSSSIGDIFVINADGSNLRRLTSAVSDRFPKFSPDGTKIAFIRSGRIFTINADGTGQTQISTAINYSRFDWSPDGARIMFVQGFSTLGVMNADGTNPIVYSNNGSYSLLSWGADPSEQTPVGAGVNVVTGGTAITFNTVSSGGTTTVTPISPASAGTAPNGFSLGQFGAFEINTTAAYTPPVTICVTLPLTITQTQFNLLNILHNENGVLVNRTSSRNFAARQICATVNSFSPFAIAEQIEPNLPIISGLIQDSNGNPLSSVSVNLTGAEERTTTTDSNGAFSFVNLSEGANYNVKPKKIGYLFNEYSRDFVNLTGEQTIFFAGSPANFQISGRISVGNGSGIGGVNVELDGDAQDSALTDASGNYVFTNLPADGFYTLTPFNGVNNFSPASAVVAALTSDAGGVNFQTFAPTAASVSIGGRVITPDGRGLRNARVVLTDSNGRARTVSTSSFGYYRFDDVEVGRTYLLGVESKKYRFQSQVLVVYEELTELNLTVED